jgi:hypothetical protein
MVKQSNVCYFTLSALSLMTFAQPESFLNFSCNFIVSVFLLYSRSYLEVLCTTLYDVLQPFIIHINHLETPAEVCSILRLEMLEEHVQNHRKYTALSEGCGHSTLMYYLLLPSYQF